MFYYLSYRPLDTNSFLSVFLSCFLFSFLSLAQHTRVHHRIRFLACLFFSYLSPHSRMSSSQGLSSLLFSLFLSIELYKCMYIPVIKRRASTRARFKPPSDPSTHCHDLRSWGFNAGKTAPAALRQHLQISPAASHHNVLHLENIRMYVVVVWGILECQLLERDAHIARLL